MYQGAVLQTVPVWCMCRILGQGGLPKDAMRRYRLGCIGMSLPKEAVVEEDAHTPEFYANRHIIVQILCDDTFRNC